MTINVSWVDENQEIVLIKYDKRWTWTEFHETVNATNAMISAINHPVIAIHDTLQGSALPPGNIITQGKTAFAGAADNISLIIVVSSSSMIQTFLSLVAKLVPSGQGRIIKSVFTLEEAYQLCKEAQGNSR